jgi:hypothetical protein
MVRWPWSTSDDASSPIKSIPMENPKTIGKISRKSSAALPPLPTNFRGTEVSVPAPYRDGEVPPEPSPLVSIAVSAISIDLTGISIAVAASYDEEGVVLPRG